ncbi:MAG: HAD family hydrolase [Candidatus Thermoplasmatota archaeon]|nr:HAD family hydrolase [Candidatus Thermoplasmatota archaeon]
MTSIKAIIFDVDDTLYDCSKDMGELRRSVAKAMIASGLNADEDVLYKKMMEIAKTPRLDMFKELRSAFNITNEKIIESAKKTFYSADVQNISPFPDVLETLDSLRSYKLFVVTSGNVKLQERKIEILELKDRFDYIRVVDVDKNEVKKNAFIEILEKFDLKPDEVMCVGDRITSEIKDANELGMVTVRILSGRFKGLEPINPEETPDYNIQKISEIPKILNRLTR